MRRAVPALVVLALVLGAAGVAATWAYTDTSLRTHVVVTLVVMTVALLVSGVLGSVLRPASRIGPLLCVAAVVWLLPYLQDSHIDVLASTGYLARDLWLAVIIHIVVTYPDGRGSRWAQLLVAAAYLRYLVPNVATALFTEAPAPLQNHNFFTIGSAPELVADIHRVTNRQVAWVLGAAVVLVLVLRLARGTRASRAADAPLVVATAVTLAYFMFLNFSCGPMFGWQNGGDTLAFAAIPLSILAALTGGRRARSRMGDLLIDIGGQPDSGALRHALARALRDPTVELAYRLGPEDEWVTPEGAALELPIGDARRTVSYLERDGEPVAAIVHDAVLQNEPERLEPVRQAVQLLLDNERLTAQVRRQLEEVRASRRRIVEAGDQARRTVERNLHDGAQQRLVGLALNLRLAQRGGDPSTALLLEEFAGELEGAIAELRELGRGIHPSVVSESGLVPALGALARRSPLPVATDVDLPGRYEDTVEATVYYVVAEALTNVARYASASGASVTAFEAGDHLHVEVRDDGVGGAGIGTGSGLSGLHDRVEAIGGTLIVESPPGEGTRVGAQLPLSSRRRAPGRERSHGAGIEAVN